MFKINLWAICLLSFCACTSTKKDTDHIRTISSGKEDITILYNKQAFPWKIQEDNISFPFSGKANAIGFITDSDTLEFALKPADTVHLNFILKNTDTVKVAAIGQANPVKFDTTYIDNHRGKYRVYLPEVHELVNIAVALTDIGRKDSNMVYMKTDYYQKVMDHFDRHKGHALIDSLNQHITEVFGNSTYSYYYNIRMNANMYTFEKDGIVNNSPYRTMGFGGTNELEPLLPLLYDFAEKSDFKAFYQEHQDYYDSLVATYYELVPIDKMWKWVEDKFPQRYDSYKIYFSPLVGGAHSTQGFSDNGFKETVMFIDAPIFQGTYTQKEKEAILSRIVFTEIDHNYVNPTTDKFPEISNLMQPLHCWNNGTQSYGSSIATFNEYMTWALFSIYLHDEFGQEVFEKRNKREANFMAKSRGFLRFPEFNAFVLDWYKNNPGQPLEALYPAAIEWISTHPCGDS